MTDWSLKNNLSTEPVSLSAVGCVPELSNLPDVQQHHDLNAGGPNPAKRTAASSKKIPCWPQNQNKPSLLKGCKR